MKICYALINSDKEITNYIIKNFKFKEINFITNDDLLNKEFENNEKYLNNFEILKYLRKTFLYCLYNEYEYCIFNIGNGFFLNSKKLISFINNFALKERLFSFRITKAGGLYWNQEPKLPFIDNHFIIMNIKQLKKKNFFSNKLINFCHHNNSFINNAILSSFIEYSLKREQIENHFFSDSICNEYGKIDYLNPLNFQICEKTSFVTYYKNIKNNDKIFYKNLNKNLLDVQFKNNKDNSCYIYKKNIFDLQIYTYIKSKIIPKYKELDHNEKRIKR